MSAEQPAAGDINVLPCGCIVRLEIKDGEKVMVMIPCSQGCGYLQFAIGYATVTGKPIDYEQAP